MGSSADIDGVDLSSSRRAAQLLAAGSTLWALNGLNASTRVFHRAARQVPGPSGAGLEVLLSFAGLGANELPLHAVAGEALAAAYLTRRGALRHRVGRAGLALAAASWVGLAGLYRRERRAPEVLERALREGLGADYRSRLPADDYPGEVPITRREVVLPRRGSRRRYAHASDLSYGEFGRRNLLDVWRRADLPADAAAPVLIQIHGSGWFTGSKRGQSYPLLSHMAERGWVCVAINYRLSPAAVWPAHVVDVKQAVGWVKQNIGAYGGDPGFVALTGGSAGGQLCALAALTPNEAEFQPGFEHADTAVSAAVPFYGVYDFTNRDGTCAPRLESFLERYVMQSRLADDRQRWERASPMSWVKADAPPFFIIHGADDMVTPVANARAFAAMLGEVSRQPVAYGELPGGHHAFDLFRSVRTIHTVRAVDRFLSIVRADAGQRAGRDQSPPSRPSQAARSSASGSETTRQ